jgi:hypothetical protein
MGFFFLAVTFMYIGRKAGWALSRNILDRARTSAAIMLCAAWGFLVALAMRGLIDYQQPGIILRWIMGYWLAAYVAIPNFGLRDESTIPNRTGRQHTLVSTVPLCVFIVSSICLALGVRPVIVSVVAASLIALSFLAPSLFRRMSSLIEQGQLTRRFARVLIKGSVIFLAWMILAAVTEAALGLPTTFYGDPTPLRLAADFLPLVVVVWILADRSWPNWPRLK